MTSRNGQVFIGFKCDTAFREEIARAAGNEPLSQFVRDALIERLRAMNITVPRALADAPSRLGKGGPRKLRIVPFQEQDARVAETPEPATIRTVPPKPVRYSAKTKPASKPKKPKP